VKPSKPAAGPPGFRVLCDGINYPDGKGGEKRVERGGIASGIPAESVVWLLEQGAIESLEAAPAPEPTKPPTEQGDE